MLVNKYGMDEHLANSIWRRSYWHGASRRSSIVMLLALVIIPTALLMATTISVWLTLIVGWSILAMLTFLVGHFRAKYIEEHLASTSADRETALE